MQVGCEQGTSIQRRGRRRCRRSGSRRAARWRACGRPAARAAWAPRLRAARPRRAAPRARARWGSRRGRARARPRTWSAAPPRWSASAARCRRRAARCSRAGAVEPDQLHTLLRGTSEEGDRLLRRVQRNMRTVQLLMSMQPCPRRPSLLSAQAARNFCGVGRPIKPGQRPARRAPRATPRARAQERGEGAGPATQARSEGDLEEQTLRLLSGRRVRSFSASLGLGIG